ncbi:MAG: hypothetical protein IJC34_04655, partial [Lentisphaeria bacterium]|nr:hypothetical protein [Lentisphaeria bacterium]
MQLDTQWFMYALVEGGSLTAEHALSLTEQLGGDPDLGTCAQAILEQMAEGADESQIEELTGQIQQLMEYAVGQAAT